MSKTYSRQTNPNQWLFKSVDDVDRNEFDDELSSTKIAYLAKNFRNFLRNNNKRARSKNTVEPTNFKRNEPTKVNNTNKLKEKVGQTYSNSLGQQCFGCQEYGHVKSECPTFLRSKGKVMAITLCDDEVSEDGNFIASIATIVVDESVVVEENPFDGELSECADLQEAFNKLCKVAAKDAMSADLGLKKIASLELEKKNVLLKLLDANNLIDKVKTENMMLLDKIKNLELELSVAREQTNRFVGSKLDHMLSVQKSPVDKIGLSFVDSISMSETRYTNFVSSSEPPKIEIVKLVEVTPPPRKIRVELKESKPKNPNLPKDKKHDRPLWACHFCGKVGHIRPNYFKLQAAKRAK